MRFLPLILKNSLRNRRRSLLTITSLALSLCLLGVIMAIYYALYVSDAPPEQALRLITRHKVSLVFPMPLYYRDKIAQVPGVKAVATTQWYGGQYKDEQRDQSYFFARFAVEADRFESVYPEIKLPADQLEAWKGDQTGCIVGRDLAKRFNMNLGEKVNLKGNIFPFDAELTIRGIYDSPLDTDTLYFQLKYIEEGLKVKQPGRSFAGTFVVMAESAEAVPRVSKAIDELFTNSDAPTRTETESAFGLSFLSFLGNIKLILLSICGAVTFTILLVAANTMAMSVRERVREVGILKTLGFTRNNVLGLILGESVCISLIGAAIGLTIAAGLCAAVRHAPGVPPQVKSLGLHPPVLFTLFGVSLFIGVVSSLIPALSAAKTSILDALRFTD